MIPRLHIPMRLRALALAVATLAAASPEASGAGGLTLSSRSLMRTPEASTGLNAIYAVEDAAGATASYTAASASQTVEWYTFGSSGAAYAVPAASTRDGARSTIALPAADTGLVVVVGGTERLYYWVVNAAAHPCDIEAAEPDDADSDCAMLALTTRGECGKITYYTINGAPKTFDRELRLSYHTLAYDAEDGCYRQKEAEEAYEWLEPTLYVLQPLCDTQFTLTGDVFARAWGREQCVRTPLIGARAVEAAVSVDQAGRETENEITAETASGYGGSAPVDISFEAAVTDAAAFTEWQISQSPEFDTVDLRYSETAFAYTFREYGTFYVRFICANADDTCQWISDVIEVQIGESRLVCPNAFSPNGDGVNDEWRVSFKSITSFECHIFNRWGVRIASLSDPSQGWDGRYGGKIVGPGVYYYVIKAEGADGRKYKLSGDINIIGYKNRTGSSADADDPVATPEP